MNNRGILLLGGGGHCVSVLCALRRSGAYERIGIVTLEEKSTFDVPVVGTDEDLPQLILEGYESAFLCMGGVGSASLRRALYQQLKQIGYSIPNIIDPSAVIGEHVSLGEGIFVGKNAVINAGSRVENGAIINTGAIVEHECVIEDFAHVAPGSVICGGVRIGKGAYIGANSTVIQCLDVGENTVVGAGSVVVRSLGSNVVAYGNPCVERRSV
jgi:sugar O-acyltransferase (sialic acid O-acetyltransferase NeuD family)